MAERNELVEKFDGYFYFNLNHSVTDIYHQKP